MSRDSTGKILTVAFLLCLVCSILVSAAAVGLNDLQERNKIQERRKNILQAAGLYQPARPIDEQFQKIEARLVDLQEDTFSQAFDPTTFDSRSAARDPQTGHQIPEAEDVADIKVRSRYKVIYLVRDENGALQQLILPVHGKGLWSTMYGFLALDNDFTTVKGFAFYEHGETPGLGGEIDNPDWKEQWPGKQIYGPEGEVRIDVLKGTVDRDAPDARFKADGLAGATLTARGVENLLHYWMGEDGYRPFLEKLQAQGV